MKTKLFLVAAASIMFAIIGATVYGIISNDEKKDRKPADSEQRIIVQNILSRTFTNSGNGNPSWLDIQTGVTTSESVRQILEAHNIKYEITGVTNSLYDLFFLSESSLQLWIGMEPEAAGGLIKVDTDTNRVHNMSFGIDICVSTVIKTFGIPMARVDRPAADRSTVIYLQYPDLGLTFKTAEYDDRVNTIFLHTLAYMREEWQSADYRDWSEYADMFAGDCTDNIQALE